MWYYLYVVATGALYSESSQDPTGNTPAGMAVVSAATRESQDPSREWDPAVPGWVDAPAAPPEPVSRGTFLLRFTPAEQAAIDVASDTKGTNASLFSRFMDYTDAYNNGSGFIELDHPVLVGLVNGLETDGLIGAGRAAEVLTP